MAAVYRASVHLHRDALHAGPRQLLALDAARYGDRELSARITAVSVDEGRHARWGLEWATASPIDCRLRYALTAWNTPCVATAVVDGRPVAVTNGEYDATARVRDVVTGERIGTPLTGRTGTVHNVSVGVVNSRAVVITGGYDDSGSGEVTRTG
ncbi:hypothetical protein ACFVIM_00225 [Streptomyces sp. NPDC057638]|uniref:hypothetical protein n=1 Tax=Streptomyces sp. NPDC057638 TaxID=3346190 RepID=UPI0036BC0645